jgi:hypothetical protein
VAPQILTYGVDEGPQLCGLRGSSQAAEEQAGAHSEALLADLAEWEAVGRLTAIQM